MSGPTVEEGYAAFYARTFERVARQLRPMVGAAAEDLAQEALVVAHARWADVATLDKPDAWVRRVALRMGARHAGRERDRLVLEAATAPPAHSPPPDLDTAAAILGLPDRHAAAVRLHHLEDRPMAEVAEILGCSEGAAKVLVLRARRILAERLVGITGRWVSEHTWTVDGVARHLKAIGWESHHEEVIDRDLEGRGGQFELTIRDGSYEFRRDDGRRFDHGVSRVGDGTFDMAPILNTGRARYAARVDGRRLRLRFQDATVPDHLGVPEGVWAGIFYDVADFVRADPAARPVTKSPSRASTS